MRGKSHSPTVSSINLPSAAEVVSETPTNGRSWSKSLEPEWHARPSPYFATFASTACRKRHPVSGEQHSPAEMRISPSSGTPPISPALTHALPQVRVTIPSAGLRIVPISHRRGNRNSRKGTKMDSMADLNLTQSRRGFIKAAGATVLAGAAAAALGGCSAKGKETSYMKSRAKP